MRRLLLLTNRHRSAATNQVLGLLLAFNAGAVNAGGFLILQRYTSHMTGFASQLADGVVLGNATLWLNAIGALLSFVAGAAVCAFLVNWARFHRLHSVFALPLVLEASLLLAFGLVGTITLAWQTPFALPATVLLLSFIMGLQNAIGSKTSGGSIRTTHMTGNITDVGIGIGRALFWRDKSADASPGRERDQARVHLAWQLTAMFVLGGGAGALGFTQLGFICVLPLAALLLALSLPPLRRDGERLRALLRRDG